MFLISPTQTRLPSPSASATLERAAGLGCEKAHINVGSTRLILGNYRCGSPEYGWVSAELMILLSAKCERLMKIGRPKSASAGR